MQSWDFGLGLQVSPPSRRSEFVMAILEGAAGGFASSRRSCSGRADGRLQKMSLLKHNRRKAYDNDS
jgi:hypothetical protein